MVVAGDCGWSLGSARRHCMARAGILAPLVGDMKLASGPGPGAEPRAAHAVKSAQLVNPLRAPVRVSVLRRSRSEPHAAGEQPGSRRTIQRTNLRRCHRKNRLAPRPRTPRPSHLRSRVVTNRSSWQTLGTASSVFGRWLDSEEALRRHRVRSTFRSVLATLGTGKRGRLADRRSKPVQDGGEGPVARCWRETETSCSTSTTARRDVQSG